MGKHRRFRLSPEPSANPSTGSGQALSREKHPHPRRRRGLSRNIAGEARIKWRGTRHPNWGEGRERISRGGEFWVIVAAPFSGGARLASKALDDLIVVEFAQMVSGPMCGKMFADMGAE